MRCYNPRVPTTEHYGKDMSKKEEAHRPEYSSLADFQKSMGEYMRFYNEVRSHQTLAYKTPTRFEELYGNKKTQDI